MTSITIPEPDVLIATTRYLIQRDVIPYQFSIAAGRGIETSGAKNKLMNAYTAVNYSPNFSGNGADILALSKTEWWLVECKGAGSGKAQTQRNNFDRALASCVSYFEDNPNGLPEGFANVTIYLGLALPNTQSYLNELRRRVRSPLRERLNLWVLLYESDSKKIRAIEPHESI